jgi:hypothetical protein
MNKERYVTGFSHHKRMQDTKVHSFWTDFWPKKNSISIASGVVNNGFNHAKVGESNTKMNNVGNK